MQAMSHGFDMAFLAAKRHKKHKIFLCLFVAEESFLARAQNFALAADSESDMPCFAGFSAGHRRCT